MVPMMRLLVVAAVVVAALAAAPAPASGQQPGSAASCTASLLSSFAPCFSFLSNSSNGSTPTRECCRSLAALVNASTGCACLVLTGAVPLGVPVNRTLAVSLPRACDSMSVPLQCRDTSAPTTIPAAGPAADGPSSPASPTTTPATPEPEAPASPTADPTAATTPAVIQTRPTVLPSSSARRDSAHAVAAPALVLLLAVAAALQA